MSQEEAQTRMIYTAPGVLYEAYQATYTAKALLSDLQQQVSLLDERQMIFGYPVIDPKSDVPLAYAVATRALALSRGDIDRALDMLGEMRDTLGISIAGIRRGGLPAKLIDVMGSRGPRAYAAEALALHSIGDGSPEQRRADHERRELRRLMNAWGDLTGVYEAHWYLENGRRRYELNPPVTGFKEEE